MTLTFKGLAFKGLTMSDISPSEGTFKQIVTVNAEFIVRAKGDPRLRSIINTNISTFDGQIPLMLAKKKHKGVSIEKLSGSDLIYKFCEEAGKSGDKVFLLGGNEISNARSCDILRQEYGVTIDGFSPPHQAYPFTSDLEEEIRERVTRFQPKIIFVGFGAGKQEFWIDDNRVWLEESGVLVAMGSGGSFEFVAGEFKRAPIWVQKMGGEIIYRLFQQPNFARFMRLLVSMKIFWIRD